MEEIHKIFLFGLDNAGKTTLLKYIKDEEIIEDGSPTRKFDIISDIVINKFNFVIWDAPGQIEFRKDWGDGVKESEVLLFIFDIGDMERVQEAKKELGDLLKLDTIKGIPLIVCLHKRDLAEFHDDFKAALDGLDLLNIKDRDIYWLKTSVYQKDTVDELKFVIYNLEIILDVKANLKKFTQYLV